MDLKGLSSVTDAVRQQFILLIDCMYEQLDMSQIPRWKIEECLDPTIVNLKGRKPQQIRHGEVYIGRPINMGGWRLQGSEYANPFKVGKDGDIHEVLRKYKEHIKGRDLSPLKGKKLACWCFPSPCHGNVLVELLNSSTVVKDASSISEAV